MTMSAYAGTCCVARLFEPWEGFGSLFSHSRLDSSGPVPNLGLNDQLKQAARIGGDGQTSADPLGPQLQGMFEAQAARIDASVASGLRHQ